MQSLDEEIMLDSTASMPVDTKKHGPQALGHSRGGGGFGIKIHSIVDALAYLSYRFTLTGSQSTTHWIA